MHDKVSHKINAQIPHFRHQSINQIVFIVVKSGLNLSLHISQYSINTYSQRRAVRTAQM